MDIGGRIRELREERNLSQGDLEKATGLRRNYISRLEGGHTVPSIATLEKLAAALTVPVYQFLYEEGEPGAKKKPVRRTNTIKKEEMSDDARLFFGTLAKAFSKL
jgi:transcriptional regulator with XRE-family HTH domain